MAADGSYTYTPDANYVGADSFTYTVTDAASGESKTQSVAITVGSADDLVAADDSASTVEDTPVSGSVAGNDNTSSGGALSFAAASTPAHGSVVMAADGSYTYTPDANYVGADSFTYTVTDAASGESKTQSVAITVTDVNDAPVTADAALTGTEDAARLFQVADFSFSDVDLGDSLQSVKITSLPADGNIQVFSGSSWSDVATNQTISAAEIAAGHLRFVPDANESGVDAYGGSGTGNNQVNYASFTFQVSDGTAFSANATLTFDITPVADAPVVRTGMGADGTAASYLSSVPASQGLQQEYYQAIPTLDTVAASNAANIESAIESVTPTATTTAADLSVASVGVDDAYRFSGLVFLEAGKTYAFSGYSDDTMELKVGGEVVLARGFNSWGNYTGATFAPAESGYYTIEYFGYNGDAVGSFDVNVSVNGAAAVNLNTTNFALFPTVSSLEAVGGAHLPLVANGDGGYYPVGNAGLESTWIKLAPLSAALVDTDGSETLSVLTLTDIPVGAQLTDGIHTFTATAGNTTLSLSGWNTSNLSFMVTSATGAGQTYTLHLSATSAETVNGDSATTTVPLQIFVADSVPIANADYDSVGIAGTITGNVVTGAGGTGSGADALGVDATSLTGVTLSQGTLVSSNYNAGTGTWTMVTTNGTLSIGQGGAYSYTSSLQNILGSGGNAAGWSSIGKFGFDGSNPFKTGGAGAGLDLTKLTTPGAAVTYGTTSGDLGLGVEASGTSRIQSGEYLVLDLGKEASAVKVALSNLTSGNTAQWYAYDDTGSAAGSGTVTSNNGTSFVTTLTLTASARYVVFGYGNNDYRVESIAAVPDTSGVPADIFNYTLTDADGDTSSAALSITTNDATATVSDTATVYEAGLTAGTQAGVAVTTVTGNILANDEGVGGTSVISGVEGVVPGANGIITITNSVGSLTVYTQAYNGHVAGDYSYVLTGPTTQGSNDKPTFSYTVTNSTSLQTATGTLTINVVDDAPIGGDVAHTLQAADHLPTYNLVLIIDRSGSMSDVVSGTLTRMDILKSAVASMLDAYDGIGNVNVKIVDFSSTVGQSSWFVDDIATAKAYVGGLMPNGGTYYSSALDTAMTTDFSSVVGADKNLVYFLSDGAPTSGYAVSAAQQTNWETFLTNNQVDLSFAIGIGSGAALTPMLPISWPGDGTVAGEPYAQVVTNDTQLENTLLQTIDQGVVLGNVSVLSGGGASGFLMGADGGHIQSIVVDGVTYNYDVANPIVTVNTVRGGEFTINFATGEYHYQLSVSTTVQGQQEIIPVTAVDGDGDVKQINMTINLDYVANLDANRDTVLTNIADGSPITLSTAALTHNDAVTGDSVVSAVANATFGTVSLAGGSITFDPAATVAPTVAETAGDSSTSATNNNSINKAMDLSDRSLWGKPSAADAANVGDPNAASIHLTGTIAGTGQDNDYMKVYLKAGETLVMDIDNGYNAAAAAAVSTDLSLRLYNSSLTQLASNDTAANTSLGGGGSVATNDPYLEYTATADGYYYVRVYNATNGDVGTYDLWMSLKNTTFTANGGFDYTVSDTGANDTAHVDVNTTTSSTVTGTNASEILVGNTGSSTLIGGAGDDVLIGNVAADNLQGGAGNDLLQGGGGNDTLDGGTGNDKLGGGSGDDVMTGGLGVDVFSWSLADRGAPGMPAIDTLTDFDTATAGDKLDLRDLLQGEHASGGSANLEDFLHFEKSGANTLVHVSSNGGFSADSHSVGSGYSTGNEDQTIVLQNVDLVGSATTDQLVIQDLLNKGKLITD